MLRLGLTEGSHVIRDVGPGGQPHATVRRSLSRHGRYTAFLYATQGPAACLHPRHAILPEYKVGIHPVLEDAETASATL